MNLEFKHNVASPEEIMEPLLSLLDEVEAVPLVISGNSMTPFLVHRRDTVYLSKPDRPLKKGDMVLYQRDNGAYILHRIFKTDLNSYTMVGDAQTVLEYGIRNDQIRAVVTAVRRKGKLIQRGSFWWDFFEKVWISMVPFRPLFSKIYSAFKIFKH